MKHTHSRDSIQGSALAVSVILLTAVGAIAAYTLRSALAEHRINKYSELFVEAVNTAELGVDYGYATVIKEVTDSAGIYEDVDYFDSMVAPSGLTSYIDGQDVQSLELRASDIQNPVKKKVGENDPSAKYDQFRGKYVWEGSLDLYCKVTTSVDSLERSPTAYVKKKVRIIEAPLFSHALFYNDELQIHRPASIAGDVHTNGNLLINTHNGDDTMKFFGSVDAAGFYYRGTSVDGGGSGRDPFGNTPTLSSGEIDFDSVNLSEAGTAEIQGVELARGFDSRHEDWAEQGLVDYGGNLSDSAQGTTSLTPIGSVPASRDDPDTSQDNEYNNGGYSLIEPLLPSSHSYRKSDTTRESKLAAKADLIIRVERNETYVPLTTTTITTTETYYDRRGRLRTSTSTEEVTTGDTPDKLYVLKAYTYDRAPGAGVEPTYTNVPLPDNMIGAATEVLDGSGDPVSYEVVNSGSSAHPELYAAESSSTGAEVTSGLMDTRTGRPMDLFTLDMSRLKEVVETSNSSLSGDTSAIAFRDAMGIEGDSNAWNGIVYFEMPTSITPDTSAESNEEGLSSIPFVYGDAETKNPEELTSVSSPDRVDGIVPVAPEYRTQSNTDPGIGLQVINAGSLPSLGSDQGFTLASNGSIYTVGHYNADGDLSTGTNIGSGDNTLANTDSSDEVPASIFGDSVTILSEEWPRHRKYSNKGNNSDSTYRKPDAPLEISAAIVTGDYPVFEFFVRSLEAWQHLMGQAPNPLVIKGSLVSLYDSEIPLIKDAFGRNVDSPIDLYWNAFASYAFTTVRYHQFFNDGKFPPGTPTARYFNSDQFEVMDPSDDVNKTELESVGFSM